MIKRILKNIVIFSVLILCQAVFAGAGKTGLLFNVTGTGDLGGTASITLCLNAKGPLSCQRYTVTNTHLSITTTIPGHTYLEAGIISNSAGYKIDTSTCTLIPNGYCLFSVNHQTPASVVITSEQQFTIIPSAGAHGSISPSTAQTVAYGANSPTFTATADTGYSVSGWAVDGSAYSTCGTSTTCQLTDVTATHTIGVTFSQETFTITPSAGSNGSISPSTAQTVAYGANSPTFTATADTGYSVSGWTVDGSAYSACGTNTSCQLTDVTANHTITFSTTENIAILTAVGDYFGDFPVAVSTNGGQNWALATNESGENLQYNFVTESCAGAGSGAVCVAGGKETFGSSGIISISGSPASNWTTSSLSGTTEILGNSCLDTGSGITCVAAGENGSNPVLYVANNVTPVGGAAWTPVTVTGSNVHFNSTSCTGSAGSVVCTAAGTGGLLYVSNNGDGSVWTKVSGIPTTITFQTTSCTGSGTSALCIAAGGPTSGIPSLYLSTNGGSTWNLVSLGITHNGTFYGSSCTGTGSNAVCTLVGQNTSSSAPFFYVGTNTGAIWTPISPPAASTALYSTSCTGSGSTAVCTAVGQNSTSNPVIFVSSNGGGAWSSVTTITDTAKFLSTTCIGGSSATCIVAGETYDTQSTPLLYVSTNSGASWTPAIPGTNTGSFNATGCTDQMCTAAGELSTNPLLSISSDGGTTWNVVNTTTDIAYFSASTCSGYGSSALCIAVGADYKTNHPLPLLYQSTDGGSSWNAVSGITSDQGWLYSVSCTSGGASRAMCIAVGNDLTTSNTFLFQTLNGGATWTPVSIGSGSFKAASCSDTLCIAVGSGNNNPLLYQTVNGGTSWTPVTTDTSGAGSSFSAASCAGSLCIAAGADNNTSNPLLYQTVDGGTTWTPVLTDTSNTGSYFSAASCAGSLCIAAGQDNNTLNPLLYQTVDGGTTWIPVLTDISGTASYFNAASCVGSICIAAGESGSATPMLYASIAQSAWSLVTTTTDNGLFYAATCTISGINPVCIAVGTDDARPLLYQTLNNGTNWNNIATTTDRGMFNGSGSN